MPLELRPWAKKLKEKFSASRRHENEEPDSLKEKKPPPLPREQRQSRDEEDTGTSGKDRRSSVENRFPKSREKSQDRPRKSKDQESDPRRPDMSFRQRDGLSRHKSSRRRRERHDSAGATLAIPHISEEYRDQEPAPASPLFPGRLFDGSLIVPKEPVDPTKGREAWTRADGKDEDRNRGRKYDDRKESYKRKNTGRSGEYRESRENRTGGKSAKEQKQRYPRAEARLEKFGETVNSGQAMREDERRTEAKLKREAERRRDGGEEEEERKVAAKAQHRNSIKSVPEHQHYRALPELNMENLSEYDKLFLDDGPEESVLGRGIGNMNRTVLEGFARVPEKYWKKK